MKRFLREGSIIIIIILLFSSISFGYTDKEKEELMKIPPKQHCIEDYLAMFVNRVICDTIDKIEGSGLIPKYKNDWDNWVRRQEIQQEEFQQRNR